MGPGEGALGRQKIRSAPGVDRRLQTLGGGGEGRIRGGLRFQTPVGAEQERARALGRRGAEGVPGTGPKWEGAPGPPARRGGGPPGGRGWGGGTPGPRGVVEEVPRRVPGGEP